MAASNTNFIPSELIVKFDPESEKATASDLNQPDPTSEKVTALLENSLGGDKVNKQGEKSKTVGRNGRN